MPDPRPGSRLGPTPRELCANDSDTPCRAVVRAQLRGTQAGAGLRGTGTGLRTPGLRGAAIRSVVGVALAVALLLVSGCVPSGARSTDGGYVGSTASTVTVVPPDQRKAPVTVSGATLGGTKTISSADFAGKVLVVNVWGSWCPPCRQEAPELQTASERTKGKAAFLGITTKDYDPAPAEAFVRRFQITYPSIFDPTGNALLAFGGDLPPSAIPSTLVLDAQGRVAVRVLGTVTADTLVDMVDDVAAGK